jgi:hypothetical protein
MVRQARQSGLNDRSPSRENTPRSRFLQRSLQRIKQVSIKQLNLRRVVIKQVNLSQRGITLGLICLGLCLSLNLTLDSNSSWLNLKIGPLSGRWGALPSTAQTVRSGDQTLGQDSNQGWLMVQYLQGVVSLGDGGPTRPARMGDRLRSVGATLATGSRSAVVLQVDAAIGTIQVAENTEFRIGRLQKFANQSRLTSIEVLRGQVRLQLRRFTSPLSRFEIATPSGIAAVRGTEFGVDVDPKQRMTVATEVGKVNVSAQSQTVPVTAGLATVVFPGQPPQPPRPVDRVLGLSITQAQRRFEGGVEAVDLSGHINVTNTVVVNDQTLEVNSEGYFKTRITVPRRQTIQVIVRNALGSSRTYSLRSS